MSAELVRQIDRTVTVFERPGFYYISVEPAVDREQLSKITRPHKNFPAYGAYIGHWPIAYLAVDTPQRQILGIAEGALAEDVDMLGYASQVARSLGARVVGPILSEADFEAREAGEHVSSVPHD